MGGEKAEMYGVVLTSQEEWQTLCAQIKAGRYADYSDAALIVEFLANDQGSFVHSHISPSAWKGPSPRTRPPGTTFVPVSL